LFGDSFFSQGFLISSLGGSRVDVFENENDFGLMVVFSGMSFVFLVSIFKPVLFLSIVFDVRFFFGSSLFFSASLFCR